MKMSTQIWNPENLDLCIVAMMSGHILKASGAGSYFTLTPFCTCFGIHFATKVLAILDGHIVSNHDGLNA